MSCASSKKYQVLNCKLNSFLAYKLGIHEVKKFCVISGAALLAKSLKSRLVQFREKIEFLLIKKLSRGANKQWGKESLKKTRKSLLSCRSKGQLPPSAF